MVNLPDAQHELIKVASTQKPAKKSRKHNKGSENSVAKPNADFTNAEVENGFRYWTTAWFMDKYVPNSAHALERGFKNGALCLSMENLVLCGKAKHLRFPLLLIFLNRRKAINSTAFAMTITHRASQTVSIRPGGFQNTEAFGAMMDEVDEAIEESEEYEARQREQEQLNSILNNR